MAASNKFMYYQFLSSYEQINISLFDSAPAEKLIIIADIVDCFNNSIDV